MINKDGIVPAEKQEVFRKQIKKTFTLDYVTKIGKYESSMTQKLDQSGSSSFNQNEEEEDEEEEEETKEDDDGDDGEAEEESMAAQCDDD